ncbi:MAG: hypothetical protein LBO74_03895, partial [Candidatus Symbiothrix sp.]|jgi:hypothetical protein|nr:hypothetical protein [Candidatus Symbiothrix sp.]
LCKNCFGNNVDYGKIAFDIDKMTEKNDWIAIVHIDGNGFGKITQNIENDEDKLKIFSSKLDDVTKEAAQFAFKELNLDLNKTIPVRPIILGGDDLTIICRADLAIKYTKVFMESFETKSKASLKEGLEETGLEKLTTCAGIAFIKSSYPFYYGYDLAEELCNQAKNDAKKHLVNGLAPSCLMFHKVQDSFVDNYETIVERELTTLKGISFKYGPYYLSETKEHADKKTVTSLLDIAEKLEKDSEGNALKSHFREWISLLFTNPDRAKQAVDRMRVIFNKDELINKVTDLSNKETPVYDILSLQSVIYQETKDNNKENQ